MRNNPCSSISSFFSYIWQSITSARACTKATNDRTHSSDFFCLAAISRFYSHPNINVERGEFLESTVLYDQKGTTGNLEALQSEHVPTVGQSQYLSFMKQTCCTCGGDSETSCCSENTICGVNTKVFQHPLFSFSGQSGTRSPEIQQNITCCCAACTIVKNMALLPACCLFITSSMHTEHARVARYNDEECRACCCTTCACTQQFLLSVLQLALTPYDCVRTAHSKLGWAGLIGSLLVSIGLATVPALFIFSNPILGVTVGVLVQPIAIGSYKIYRNYVNQQALKTHPGHEGIFHRLYPGVGVDVKQAVSIDYSVFIFPERAYPEGTWPLSQLKKAKFAYAQINAAGNELKRNRDQGAAPLTTARGARPHPLLAPIATAPTHKRRASDPEIYDLKKINFAAGRFQHLDDDQQMLMADWMKKGKKYLDAQQQFNREIADAQQKSAAPAVTAADTKTIDESAHPFPAASAAVNTNSIAAAAAAPQVGILINGISSIRTSQLERRDSDPDLLLSHRTNTRAHRRFTSRIGANVAPLPPLTVDTAAPRVAPAQRLPSPSVALEQTPHPIRMFTPRASTGGAAGVANPSNRASGFHMSPQRAAAAAGSSGTPLANLVIDMPANAPAAQQMQREANRKTRAAERRKARVGKIHGSTVGIMFRNDAKNTASSGVAAGGAAAATETAITIAKNEFGGTAHSANPGQSF